MTKTTILKLSRSKWRKEKVRIEANRNFLTVDIYRTIQRRRKNDGKN